MNFGGNILQHIHRQVPISILCRVQNLNQSICFAIFFLNFCCFQLYPYIRFWKLRNKRSCYHFHTNFIVKKFLKFLHNTKQQIAYKQWNIPILIGIKNYVPSKFNSTMSVIITSSKSNYLHFFH